MRWVEETDVVDHDSNHAAEDNDEDEDDDDGFGTGKGGSTTV